MSVKSRMHAFTLATAVVLMLTCRAAFAQQTTTEAPPANFRVLAVGGFLGQLDGFCEQPGGTYDIPVNASPCGPNSAGGRVPATPAGSSRWPGTLGGLLGARSWLHEEVAVAKAANAAKPLILITANNQVANFSLLGTLAVAPLTPVQRSAAAASVRPESQVHLQSHDFWETMRDVGADAIALGPEDFVRSLRRVDRTGTSAPAAPVSSFLDWIASLNLPLLATNVVVRTHKNNLNHVDSKLIGGYTLSVDGDSSADWHTPFSIEYPCAPHPQFELWESDGNGTPVQLHPITESAATCDGRAKFTFVAGSLRPGKAYEVRVKAAKDGRALTTLTFNTHHALTPRANGLPVIMRTGPDGEPVFIVAMVDASTKKALGKQAWEWEITKKERREIDFLAPEAVLTAIAERLVSGVDGVKSSGPPIVVLLSALEDAGTLKVIDAFPEIRVVVLPQDSALLGRASRPTAEEAKDRVGTAFGYRRGTVPRFSGDLGLSGVLNSPQSSGTTLIARPQWIGETVADLQAHVARSKAGEWDLLNPSSRIQTIPGAPLEATWSGQQVSYQTTWRGKSYELGTFDNYLRCEIAPVPPACADYRELWTSKPVFDAVAGAALRRAMRAELAVVPVDFVDDYVAHWLKSAVASAPTDWISRFVLQRSVFRSHHAVRAIVPGDKLLDTLFKIVADPVGYCVVGIGNGCLRTLDKARLDRIRVNGRAIDPKLAYSVAIPDVLAESLTLRHSDNVNKVKDALGSLDKHLEIEQWFAPPEGNATLPERLATRANRKSQSYLLISGFEFGFNKLELGLPHENGSALSALDVDFKGAKVAETVTVKAGADLAVLDTVRQAVRLTASVDYQRREDADGFSFDRDETTIGARYDFWKFHIFRETRPYVGYFVEGPYAAHTSRFSASRTIADATRPGFTTQEQASDKTPLTIEPSRFWYTAIGLDVSEAWKLPVSDRFSFALSQIGLQAAFGERRDLPMDIFINGESQTIDQYLLLGAKQLLNKYFERQPEDFTSGVRYRVEPGDREQRRFQANLATETVLKLGGRDFKFGTELRHRRYSTGDPSPLALKRSWKTVVRLTIPIWWRLEFAPTFEYQLARIQAEKNNVFQSRRFEVLLKLPIVMKRAFGFFVN